MQLEEKGGKCQFDDTLKSNLRLRPFGFGSRKTIGNESHFHSHPGECLASRWGVLRNRHYLWGREFTLIGDCRAILWLLDYNGDNHSIQRLQLDMCGYFFTIAKRPGHMLEDANYFSRLGQDHHFDPLLKIYKL